MVAALQTTEAAQTIGEAEGWLPLSARQLEQKQRADETLVLVRDWLEAGQRPSWPEVSARGPEEKAYHSQWGCFQLHDGVVRRRWQDPRGGGTPRDSPGGSPADSPDGAAGPAVAAAGPPPRGVRRPNRRPNRRRRAPGHLKDYVTGDGVAGDD
ncbi:unnamed protein product [Arctogadus glacialis]